MYEDGDGEELDAAELRELMVPVSKVSASTKQLLRDFAKSSASPCSNKEETTSEKKPESSSEKFRFGEPETTSLKESSVVATNAKVELRLPIDTEENFVSKTFFGFGVFFGVLVSYQHPHYRVIFLIFVLCLS